MRNEIRQEVHRMLSRIFHGQKSKFMLPHHSWMLQLHRKQHRMPGMQRWIPNAQQYLHIRLRIFLRLINDKC